MSATESLFQFLRWRWIYTRQWFGRQAWRVGLTFKKWRYDHGVRLAQRLCKGNRYGDHTPLWPAKQPLGGSCLCARVRRRLDYIPF